MAALPAGPFCVGFAAESENLADYAQAKRARKGIPMIECPRQVRLRQHEVNHATSRRSAFHPIYI